MLSNRSTTNKSSPPNEAIVSSSSTSPIADSTNSNNKLNKSNTNLMNTNLNSNLLNTSFNQVLSYEFNEEQEECLHYFDKWSPVEQTEFVENLLRRMCHFQHGHINNFLKPMLQRDFISSLPGKNRF